MCKFSNTWIFFKLLFSSECPLSLYKNNQQVIKRVLTRFIKVRNKLNCCLPGMCSRVSGPDLTACAPDPPKAFPKMNIICNN